MVYRSSVLFSIYAAFIVTVLLGLGWTSLYSLEKAGRWDNRIKLAQQSYSLHQQLQANVYKLFKQNGDALLVGDRDKGAEERYLKIRINQDIEDIRTIIAREIETVGEEEIEELELLEQISAVIRQINTAIYTFTESGEPIDSSAQVSMLTDLLDREIDVRLAQLIDSALEEEREEMEEALSDAASFRLRNKAVAFALMLSSLVIITAGFISFHRQIHTPLIRMKRSLAQLRKGDYRQRVDLGGSLEFRQLSTVMNDMAGGLEEREASRNEQQKKLELMVQHRTHELQKMVNQLERGEKNRKQLMADISHELRTPLTIILGEAEVALRNGHQLKDETSDVLARIRDSAAHTNHIVNDLLTVARHEAGELRLDRRKTDLRQVINAAVDMFPQNVILHMPRDKASLSIDEVRIRQSVLALFQNARRHGGPTIEVSLSPTTDGFQIAVQDDGPGLSDDEKNSAFDRFYRGSNASEKSEEGSGLGLPVVKSIVEAHGGHVTLGDADLGGLLVQIDLPARQTMRVVKPTSARKQA